MTSKMDKRGRVLVPKELREAHGLTPGSPVIVEAVQDGVRIRPALPKTEALDRLAGAIDDDTRRRPPDDDAVEDVKRIWESP